ncbi:MAG: hypothetical protein IPG22_03625 [Acidobacteria bacterium]|nr:hypothetical protein [Acidobacteriota bacterium]
MLIAANSQTNGIRPERMRGDRATSYSNFISALAKRITASREESEAAKKEIFADIRRYASKSTVATTTDRFESLIARRRLVRFLSISDSIC